MKCLDWLKQFADKYLGGSGGSYSDDILEFDPVTGQWKKLGKMKKARHHHAAAVIIFDSGLCVV